MYVSKIISIFDELTKVLFFQNCDSILSNKVFVSGELELILFDHVNRKEKDTQRPCLWIY